MIAPGTFNNSDGLAAASCILASLIKGDEHPTDELAEQGLPGASEIQELGYPTIGLDLLKAAIKSGIIPVPTQGSSEKLHGEALYLSGAV